MPPHTLPACPPLVRGSTNVWSLVTDGWGTLGCLVSQWLLDFLTGTQWETDPPGLRRTMATHEGWTRTPRLRACIYCARKTLLCLG